MGCGREGDGGEGAMPLDAKERSRDNLFRPINIGDLIYMKYKSIFILFFCKGKSILL